MTGQIRSVAKKVSNSRRFRILTFILVFVVLILGLAVSYVERRGFDPVITTLWDGLYFAVTTVTGVGYGDMVPVTDMGRVIAMILQTVGVVLFGTIVALVAVELLRYQEDFYMRRVMERIDSLEDKLDELKKHLDYLVKK